MITQKQIEEFLENDDERILVESIKTIVLEINGSANNAGLKTPKIATVLRAISRVVSEFAYELDEEELKLSLETE